MTTRHDKQEERLNLRDQIHQAILDLHYWPAHWQIHVELARSVDAQLWFRRRKKRDATGQQHLLLRLGEDWLANIHAQGRACWLGQFILLALPCSEVYFGAEQCWLVETAYFEGRDTSHGRGRGDLRLRTFTGHFALYGGAWAEGDNAYHACQNAARPFREVFESPEIPF